MTPSAPGMLRARPLAGFAGILLAAALLFGWPAAPRAETPAAAGEANAAIAGNPGAVNIAPGTGALGRLLLIDGQADLNMLAHIPGASLGVAVLRFDGQPTNQQAGIVTGYNGLTGSPPLDRTELYELWWRQSFFADKLVLRIGKTVPTYDFGNVARPVPVQDVGLQIPAVSGLLYTPVFVNPTILGALPGYYNSAYGITVTVAPSRRLYVSAGIYDGNLARGQQTGLRGTPTINGYRFQIAEAGTAWVLGPDHLPGSLAMGRGTRRGRSACPRRRARSRRTALAVSMRSPPSGCGAARAMGVPAACRGSCNSVPTTRARCSRPGMPGSASRLSD